MLKYRPGHRINIEKHTRSLGTGVFLMTSIPLLNFIAMPVAVCAATRLTTRTIDNGNGPG